MSNRVLLAAGVLALLALACAVPVGTPPPLATASPTRTPRATATQAEDVQTIAVVRQAFVNVRTEPDGAVIGYVEAGQEVEIVECQDNWCLLVEPAGYVFQGCLSIADELGCTAK
jgi:SH3-like domain-containing protein